MDVALLAKGALTPEQIKELMAGSRTRNAYGPRVAEFEASDEAAINPAEVWPEFAEKSATSLYQGFITAIKKASLENTIKVIKRDETVFLMHLERANALVAALNGANTSSPDEESDSSEA